MIARGTSCRRPGLIQGVILLLAASTVAAQYNVQSLRCDSDDPAVVSRFPFKRVMLSSSARAYALQVEHIQASVRDELALRNVQITESVSLLLNAVFVAAPKDRVEELRAVPYVAAIVPFRRYRLFMNTATELVNAPRAWNRVGGFANAGRGV
jgi:hypothetical protein